MTKIESPLEILKQTTSRGKFIWKIYEKANKEFQKLRKKALEAKADGKLLVFLYPSHAAGFTGIIANELMYRNQDKIVIIGREKDDRVILSARSSTINIRDIFKHAVESVNGYGGGHEMACGGSVPRDNFHKFLELMNKEIS